MSEPFDAAAARATTRAAIRVIRGLHQTLGELKEAAGEAAGTLVENAPSRTGARGVDAVVHAIEAAGDATSSFRGRATPAVMGLAFEATSAALEAGYNPTELASSASSAAFDGAAHVASFLSAATSRTDNNKKQRKTRNKRKID